MRYDVNINLCRVIKLILIGLFQLSIQFVNVNSLITELSLTENTINGSIQKF